MTEDAIGLSGATRLHMIVGDPIAQVKSPAGMTAGFAARGYDGILIPIQVSAADLAAFLAVADTLKNLDGIVVTVPHKFACFAHCKATSDRARFIGAANIMRRRPEGGWYGDIVDGLGFVGAVRGKGFNPSGKRALQIGAGGAGSAIAHALIEAGVQELALHDESATRRDELIGKLNSLGKGRATVGSPDPSGFDMVCNATPAGMRPADPLPVDVSRLSSAMFVGCVITHPAISPLIAEARARGCSTSTGTDMYLALQSAMLDFLVPSPTSAR
jgi:shikimate dehydrogenase